MGYEQGLAALDAVVEADKQIMESLVLRPITIGELESARLAPRTIVPNFLYADVRTRIAAGGVGKTTLALHEAARLALGKPVWGKTPEHPVRTCMVTREDRRGILVARLREVMKAQQFTEQEKRTVLDRVQIIDLSSESFRVAHIVGDMVMPHTDNLTALCETLKPWSPDWVIFDPLVSFGVGEARVNDAEQGLIEAFRIIRNELDCCVEGIHHSGKANSREKTTDQYSNRGGSALPDGSRMVAVIQPLDQSEWSKQTGTRLETGESGLIMSLPKLSYCAPLPDLYIRRFGFYFSLETASQATPDQIAQHNVNLLRDFISAEWLLKRKYSKSDLDTQTVRLGLTRTQLRQAITELTVSGQLIYHEVRGKSGSHFEPVTGNVPKQTDTTPAKKTRVDSNYNHWRKVFENAWWTSGAELNDGNPYITRSALIDYMSKNARSPAGKLMTASTVEKYLKPEFKHGLLKTLVEGGYLEAYQGGWVVCDKEQSQALVISKNGQKYDTHLISGSPAEKDGDTVQKLLVI